MAAIIPSMLIEITATFAVAVMLALTGFVAWRAVRESMGLPFATGSRVPPAGLASPGGGGFRNKLRTPFQAAGVYPSRPGSMHSNQRPRRTVIRDTVRGAVSGMKSAWRQANLRTRTFLGKLAATTRSVPKNKVHNDWALARSGTLALRTHETAAYRNGDAVLSRERQWDRATSLISSSVVGAQSLRKTQQAASDKLDAAGYALERLLSEIEGLVAVKPATAEVTAFPRQSVRSATGSGPRQRAQTAA